MDYDKTDIAAVYDSARGFDPDILQEWLALLSAQVPEDGVSRIVDLGCGTGRFTKALSLHFDADAVGIDPSEKMLQKARAKSTRSAVTFKQGSGELLPLEDSSADMVFMSMIYHHLPEPERTARECHRVLRKGGHVCIRNCTFDAIESYSYLKFFDGLRSILESHLVSRKKISGAFMHAGFKAISHSIVPHRLSPDWRSFADKMSKRAYSSMTRLPDDNFHAGMAALRAHAEQADSGEAVTEDVDFLCSKNETLARKFFQ